MVFLLMLGLFFYCSVVTSILVTLIPLREKFKQKIQLTSLTITKNQNKTKSNKNQNIKKSEKNNKKVINKIITIK